MLITALIVGFIIGFVGTVVYAFMKTASKADESAVKSFREYVKNLYDANCSNSRNNHNNYNNDNKMQ